MLTYNQRDYLCSLALSSYFGDFIYVDDSPVTICEVDGKMVGWASAALDWTIGVVVKTEYRGRGIGTQLVSLLLDYIPMDREWECRPRYEYPQGKHMFEKIIKEKSLEGKVFVN